MIDEQRFLIKIYDNSSSFTVAIVDLESGIYLQQFGNFPVMYDFSFISGHILCTTDKEFPNLMILNIKNEVISNIKTYWKRFRYFQNFQFHQTDHVNSDGIVYDVFLTDGLQILVVYRKNDTKTGSMHYCIKTFIHCKH